ncbi:uncharacterized protein LOC134438093 [Engraulis encrasicolus]|uniref:uncharacterized protein LOC134438093 n=1 Tax=Engraulis encrasicolus TaxID=184585 RepID=UPI002FD5C502
MDTSSSDDELVLLCLERRKKKRDFWVHPLLQRRQQQGEYHNLVQELKLYAGRFKQYFRMSVSEFEALLLIVAPHLEKQRTNYRVPIDPEQRLAVCLRFLSTGDSYSTIANSFRLGKSTVGKIIVEACEVLWEQLVGNCMPQPTEDLWRGVASGFQKRWNFPNCIGAIDGKHVLIKKPAKSGSLYYNYKGFYSVVLLALVDHNCNFIAVDVGGYGSNSDGGIFDNSKMGKRLKKAEFHVPPPAPLPRAPQLGSLPHTIVADDAFPLKQYIMKPYPGRHLPEDRRIFNYRLSRARRTVENAFGILVHKWRVYDRKIPMEVDNVDKVIKATCVLTNYIRQGAGDEDDRQSHGVGDDRQSHGDGDRVEGGAMPRLDRLRGHRRPLQAMRNRDILCQFFNSPEGEVPWQYQRVRRGIEI